MYPTLSDQEAQSMAQRIAVESKRSAKELRDRQGCDEVAWLLGTHFTLIAFPNEFGQIVDGCFGEQMAVVANTNQYLQEHHAIANRVSAGSLLIGTLRFSDRSVNWDDVGTALQSLSACAEPGTDLLLLTDLSEPPPIETAGKHCRERSVQHVGSAPRKAFRRFATYPADRSRVDQAQGLSVLKAPA